VWVLQSRSYEVREFFETTQRSTGITHAAHQGGSRASISKGKRSDD
jgi:hypothetical protein